MGCCLSHPSGPNSPYPGGGAAPSASARAINQPPNSSAPRVLSPSSAGPSGAGSGLASPISLRQSQSHQQQSSAQHQHHQQQQSQRRRHRQNQQPLSQHINKPLRRHRWVSRDNVWTRQALARERADFFDTRVTGRVEIWQTIHAALEMLWESAPPPTTTSAISPGASPQQPSSAAMATAATTTNTTTTTTTGSSGGRHDRPVISPIQPNQDQDEALATAQSILSAAEITLPSGDLAQGVYDALGNYYSLPEWIVSDPLNVVDASDLPPATDDDEDGDEDEDEDDDELVRDAKRSVYVAASSSPADEDRGDDGHGHDRRRGEKGKGVEPAAKKEETISVRCRLSENARDVVVTIGKNDTVKCVARKVLAAAGLPSSSRIRIAYLGRILRDHAPLVSQGWKEGHVLNALVFHLY
ncbi:hypothetical protein MAPG_04237 [Magnaporthiopsis poae ATCC 64411]|uniref:Ubiquitin-like domain-containing protein n=1 Tax=Magnaporthiopsis poae (strain ATCC 64411 / 73-15) TaxID=644358 RepID=A0A0C4DW63_MAGP6|nr:hypothetical protein MAPG_04237 [Magnaporthiopsis poae ATCC 64411]